MYRVGVYLCACISLSVCVFVLCGGERALGKAGKVMVEIMIVVSQIGMVWCQQGHTVTPCEFLT